MPCRKGSIPFRKGICEEKGKVGAGTPHGVTFPQKESMGAAQGPPGSMTPGSAPTAYLSPGLPAVTCFQFLPSKPRGPLGRETETKLLLPTVRQPDYQGPHGILTQASDPSRLHPKHLNLKVNSFPVP